MDNICAIATGATPAGISIIRISGNSCISEINKIFKGPDLTKVSANTINYGKIINNQQIIDEVLVSVMRAPKSFTGEDIVEINCHGGLLMTEKILNIVLQLDIKLATRGEFSKRAFLNGKKNLDQITQINDIIGAKNDTALDLAINTFNTSTNELIEGLRSSLLDIITTIEVSIDYPEYDDIELLTNNKLIPMISTFNDDIEQIIIDSKRGAIFKNGLDVAIVGQPNVGKSSLLNYMSKQDKAIVTEIAGTTRDIVESTINLRGLTLNLLDTAGIRATDDVVEKIGVELSLEKINEAELVIYVLDGSRPIIAEELELYTQICTKNHIVVINKSDLAVNSDYNQFIDKVVISAFKQDGITKIEEQILKVLDLKNFDSKNAKYISRLQDISKLEQIKQILCSSLEQLSIGMPIDTIEIDLKDCLFMLGEIIGIEVQDDLLNELFSRFCLGK